MTETYTVKQVAKILGYSTNSIYAFIKEGRIKGVRVGKGRFRISLEELKRVLHLSKNPEQLAKLTEPSQEAQEVAVSAEPTKSFQLNICNLFDWFTSMVSILVGASFFLYNQFLGTIKILPFIPWYQVVQIGFIAGGLGLFLTNVFKNRVNDLWHKIFHAILILTYLVFSVMRFQIGDAGGAILFGVFTLALILDFAFKNSQLDGFLFFLVTLDIAVPGAILLGIPIFDLPPPFPYLMSLSTIFLYVWCILAILLGSLIYWAKSQNKSLLWLLMLAHGGIFLLVSYWLASNLAWGKSFFLTLAGFASLVYPMWDELCNAFSAGKKKILYILCGVLILMLLAVAVLWMLEQNLRDYATNDIENKMDYAKILIDSSIDRVKQTNTSLSQNSLLLEFIEKDRKEEADKLLGLALENNKNIRRLLIVKQDGELFDIYPYAELTKTNFAFRDYFIKAKETGKTFISPSFLSTLIDKRVIVVVSTPLTDSKGNFLGVIVASLDLERIGARLQEIGTPENKEYFVVYDNNGKIIIHPNPQYIGKEENSSESFKKIAKIEHKLITGYDYQGVNTYQYREILDNGWIINMHAPVAKILQPTQTASLILSLGVLILILSCCFYFLFFTVRKN